MESLGAAAKRLLAKLDCDAQARKKAPGRLKGREELKPEAKGREEETSQTSGIRVRGQRGLEFDADGFRVESKKDAPRVGETNRRVVRPDRPHHRDDSIGEDRAEALPVFSLFCRVG